jgi:hypothetical protein
LQKIKRKEERKKEMKKRKKGKSQVFSHMPNLDLIHENRRRIIWDIGGGRSQKKVVGMHMVESHCIHA